MELGTGIVGIAKRSGGDLCGEDDSFAEGKEDDTGETQSGVNTGTGERQ